MLSFLNMNHPIIPDYDFTFINEHSKVFCEYYDATRNFYIYTP